MQKLGEKIVPDEVKCYHCGDKCGNNSIYIEEKFFCCEGCKMVFSILSEKGLCQYYDIESVPGLKQADNIFEKRYDYLDDPDTISSLCNFSGNNFRSVTFFIPTIHCSSCIWLLEKLNKLSPGIISSKVNFLKKELYIQFDDNTTLKEIVVLLARIGYEPTLGLDSISHKNAEKKNDRSLYLKLGVAAFCFGNIMLLSFPEYLSSGEVDASLKSLFAYLMLTLSLPVIFYSALDYFISAFKGIRSKVLNIDVPLSLGIAVLFTRSVVEILVTGDPGFMDSMTGLVFLLLLGKVFKNKTYEALNFERDYTSYFPLSVTIKNGKEELSIPLAKLQKGDRIVVRNNELIPADAILIKSDANIDYSFVTGESEPVKKSSGDVIYAGGRQVGATIELETIKEVSQSYLTQLWNNDTFTSVKNERHISQAANTFSRYFTPAILLIAVAGGLFWLSDGFDIALNVFTAVLIVACPCALAVSLPFTLSNAMRILGKNRLYVKNPSVIENMSYVDTIVFDKTGTITNINDSEINYNGKFLDKNEVALIRSLARNSQHPHSIKLFNKLESEYTYEVADYIEESGNGIRGNILGRKLKLGSRKFVSGLDTENITSSSKVYVSIDGIEYGHFSINNHYRKGLDKNIEGLNNYNLHLLSGDNNSEKENLEKLFGTDTSIHFNMSAHDKLEYIKDLQLKKNTVLMIGDGLNDAGALKQSNIGISVSENINNFTPASDGILESGMFEKLESLIVFSKDSMAIIKISFVLSIFYNIAGLGFALQGLLTPLSAAILMPLSSITITAFGVLAGNFAAKRRRLL
ncbi:MAG: heavy metal translocating P-type ATPase metal-binding domain-containing protein [Ignavibacteriae bacterium]|nr:heavy metal translocating P-type ATPase metal-binding domain-containing protein [Ignavibacteriota bacterium]MCB9244240.1 heavy metal translocating P-type ATPase metal-binding domain-containing protein [Ignavibacteriales bacterium]